MRADRRRQARPSVSIGDALARWTEEELPRLTDPRRYISMIRTLQPWVAARELDDLPAVAESFKAFHRRSMASATINRHLALLRRVGNLAYHTWELIDRPIGERVRLLSEAGRARSVYLPREKEAELLAACKRPETRAVVLIAIYTGMRLGEIWSLRREHIKHDRLVLARTKNGDSATIPIVSSIVDALGFVPFTIHRRTMTRDFDAARAAIGMPDLHLHDLRRTTAVRLMEAGVELPEISLILRHKDFRTTRIYLALSPERARASLERIAKGGG
jgi:integrase